MPAPTHAPSAISAPSLALAHRARAHGLDVESYDIVAVTISLTPDLAAVLTTYDTDPTDPLYEVGVSFLYGTVADLEGPGQTDIYYGIMPTRDALAMLSWAVKGHTNGTDILRRVNPR